MLSPHSDSCKVCQFLEVYIKCRSHAECKSFKWTEATGSCQLGVLINSTESGIGDMESVFIETFGIIFKKFWDQGLVWGLTIIKISFLDECF